MNPDQVYNYSQGDLLEKPHTYQYSTYKGIEFLQAWQSNRQEMLSVLGSPQAPPDPALDQDDPFSVHSYLDHLMLEINEDFPKNQEIKSKVDAWTKKFELSKRLFAKYNESLKPVDKSKYHDMGAYVRYAEIMEKAYQRNGKLPYLNVLLKVLDTLIACRKSLDSQQRSRLAWLIEREIEHVLTLAHKRGVKI